MGCYPRDSGVTKGWLPWGMERSLLKQRPSPRVWPYVEKASTVLKIHLSFLSCGAHS